MAPDIGRNFLPPDAAAQYQCYLPACVDRFCREAYLSCPLLPPLRP
jgi:hypothetical protein